jgi:hypothetical protein
MGTYLSLPQARLWERRHWGDSPPHLALISNGLAVRVIHRRIALAGRRVLRHIRPPPHQVRVVRGDAARMDKAVDPVGGRRLGHVAHPAKVDVIPLPGRHLGLPQHNERRVHHHLMPRHRRRQVGRANVHRHKLHLRWQRTCWRRHVDARAGAMPGRWLIWTGFRGRIAVRSIQNAHVGTRTPRSIVAWRGSMSLLVQGG